MFSNNDRMKLEISNGKKIRKFTIMWKLKKKNTPEQTNRLKRRNHKGTKKILCGE